MQEEFGQSGEPYPYPTKAEQKEINKAFDALFGALKTKETDKGVALFSFAGQSSATAGTHQLATAQERMNAGEDAETVRQDTGWFKGADGKWRYEINDSDAALIGEDKWADLFIAVKQNDDDVA
jgi:hypothetical protein